MRNDGGGGGDDDDWGAADAALGWPSPSLQARAVIASSDTATGGGGEGVTARVVSCCGVTCDCDACRSRASGRAMAYRHSTVCVGGAGGRGKAWLQ